MSNKRKKIIEANLLSEQRYIKSKFLIEDEDPKPTQDITQQLKNSGINLMDLNVHNSIINQLMPYKDKFNLGALKPYVGKEDFFNQLTRYVSLKPETSRWDPKVITGQEIKLNLPGGVNLKGSLDLGQGGKIEGVGDISLQKNVNVAGAPVNLGIKYSDPTSGQFNPENVRVGAKITIPNKQKKSSGYML